MFLMARCSISSLRGVRTRAERNNDNAWGSLGLAYSAEHQPENAIPALKYALAINPYSPQNFNALGEEYVAAENFQAAADAFEQATQLLPTRSSYWNGLAAAYAAQNERDQALHALQKNEAVAAPHGTWMDWYNLGNAYNKLQSCEKAVDAYTQALTSNPRGATIWTSLGVAEQALGRLESALHGIGKVVRKKLRPLQNRRSASRLLQTEGRIGGHFRLRHDQNFESEADGNDSCHHTPSPRLNIWAAGIVDVSEQTERAHRGLQPAAQAAEESTVTQLNR